MADTLQAAQLFNQHWLFHFCSIFGTVTSAIAGATASTRVRMDFFGVIACGTIASLGGGTVRDLLLGGLHTPDGAPITVYWVTGSDVELLYYALFTSLFIFYLARAYKPPVGTIRVADAFSMAFFSLIGTSKAYAAGCDWMVSIIMGICTGVAGGALRDVLTGNVPYVFRPGELYATASFFGCALFISLQYCGLGYALSFIIGTTVAFVTRMAAVYLNWKLPSYRPMFDTVGKQE